MAEQNENITEEASLEEVSSIERCLTFESGGLTLFLSTNYVTEIINDCSITKLPLVPAHVQGILNLRGQILPVVDIRLSMGKPALEYPFLRAHDLKSLPLNDSAPIYIGQQPIVPCCWYL